MSDLQAKYDEYSSKHIHPPNATQLSRFAGVRYSAAASFLRDINNGGSSNINRLSRSQTVSFTKPSKVSFSSPTKIRTSSFSKDVLYGDQTQSAPTSSAGGVDFSGRLTGANNPWKKKQQASYSTANKSYTSSFSHSFSSKPKSKPKPKPKQPVMSISTYSPRPASPRQSTTSTASIAAVSSKYNTATKHKSPRTTHSASSSKSSMNRSHSANNSRSNINVSGLRSDLASLNANYERECNKIQQKFEEMRNTLTRKENDIINDLTNYTNQCRSIIEGNISKMEKLSKSTASNIANNNGYSSSPQRLAGTVESSDYIQIVQDTEEKQPASKQKTSKTSYSISAAPKITVATTATTSGSLSSSGVDYSGSLTGANNPWKKKQQASYSTATKTSYSSYSKSADEEIQTVSKPKPKKASSTTTTIKTFVAKPQKDVDSDEWSESETSW